MRRPAARGGRGAGPSAMILIIADPSDTGALWLRGALGRRVAGPVRLVTPAQLAYAPSIAHRLGGPGDGFRFALADGDVLTGERLTGVVNRMVGMPFAHLAHAHPDDRAYAEGELHAFLLGWLGSLDCPMLNEPSPDCLAGPLFGEIHARHFAALAGLGVGAARLDPANPSAPALATRPTMRHFVLEGRLIGPIVPAADRDSLLQFGRLWGARLMQIDSDEAGDRRRFHAASSLADFPSGGEALLRAVAEVLAR